MIFTSPSKYDRTDSCLASSSPNKVLADLSSVTAVGLPSPSPCESISLEIWCTERRMNEYISSRNKKNVNNPNKNRPRY